MFLNLKIEICIKITQVLIYSYGLFTFSFSRLYEATESKTHFSFDQVPDSYFKALIFFFFSIQAYILF